MGSPLVLTAEQSAEVNRLRDTNGYAEPSAVREAARVPTNPLHDLFEWNDAVSAEMQRLQRAREVIKAVRIDVVRGSRTVHVAAYVPSPHRAGAYQRLDEMQQDSATAGEVMRKGLERAAFQLEHVGKVSLVLGGSIATDIDRLLAELLTLKDRV